MRMRLILAASAITIASVMALPHHASAQKGPFLKPTTQWAVSEVKGDGDGTAGYCTLARRFSERTVLTMAMNEQSEASLAIDFQSPRLKTRETLSIVLDPGAGEQRYFDVMPASSSAFVVRMGQDDVFFDALSRTGLLRVEMGDQSFHFDLSDIDGGQARLTGCLSNLKTAFVDTVPAVPPGPVDMPAAAPMPQPQASTQDVTTLQSEVTRLREDINRMLAENSAIQAKAETSVGISAEELAEQSAKLKLLETENVTLKTALDAEKAKLATVEGQKAEDVNALNSLRVALEENSSMKVALEEAKAKIVELEQKNATSISPDALTKAQADASAAAEKLKQAETKIVELEKKQGEAAGIADSLTKLRLDNQALIASMEEAKAKIIALEEQKASSASPEQLTKAQDEAKAAEEKVKLAEAKIAELEKKQGEAAGVADSLAKLRTDNQALIAALDEAKAKIVALETYKTASVSKETHDATQAENMRLRDTIASMEKNHSASEQAVTETYSKDLELAKGQISELEKKLAERDQKLVEMGALSTELQSLKDRSALLEKEKTELTGALAEARRQMETTQGSQAGMQGQLLSMEQERAKLQAELQQIRAALADASTRSQASGIDLNPGVRGAVQAMPDKSAAADVPSAQETIEWRTPVSEPVSEQTITAAAVVSQDSKLKEIAPMAGSEKPVQAEELPAQAPAATAAEPLSEAQKQEAALRRVITERVQPQPVQAPEAPPVAIIKEEPPLALSRSEDPYADIEVEEMDSEKSGEPSTVQSVASQPLPEPAPQPVQTPQIVKAREQEPMPAAPAIVTETVPMPIDIKAVVAGAGIAAASAVNPVAEMSSGAKQAYQWQAGKLFGSAEVTKIADFERDVKDYLQKTEQRCSGDFAVVPSDTMQAGSARIDSYEIACVGGQVNSSASLLFVSKDGAFAAIAHEATTENMADAMEARDRLVKTIIAKQS